MRKVAKCQCCKKQEATWAWQPFGPDPTLYLFCELGWHYRGFPSIRVCDECKKLISWASEADRYVFHFTFEKQSYYLHGNNISYTPIVLETNQSCQH